MSAGWIVGPALIVAVAVGGYVLGQAEAPSATDAKQAEEQGFEEAFAKTSDAAASSARSRGSRDGRSEGERKARREGAQSGARVAASAIEAQTAVAERASIEAQPAPGTAGSDVCVAFQDYVPGVGCTPPVEPGETAAPVNCPPGTVPVGVTGACGRP